MHSLRRRLSKKAWHSRPTSPSPSPQDSLLEAPENMKDREGPDSQSLPETPLRPTHAEAASSTLASFTGAESTPEHDDAVEPSSLHSSSPRSTEVPAQPGLSTNSSIERISQVSSTPGSISADLASSPTTSSPSEGLFTRSTSGGQPPWDRSVEVVWTRHIPTSGQADSGDETASFRENIVRLGQEIATPTSPTQNTLTEELGNEITSLSHGAKARSGPTATSSRIQRKKLRNAKSPYFRLPDRIRFKIMKYVLANHNSDDKPIRMNNPVFLWQAWPVNRLTKPPVWSTDYFDSLESVLSSLDPYTSICSAMRADVLAALFLTRRFHVVYAPHMGRQTQPAATQYMDRYGPLMASITIEVDFTKLGGGVAQAASNFPALAGLNGIKSLIESFVQRQLSRRQTPIRDLRVLVRRYHGVRLLTNPRPSTSPLHFRRRTLLTTSESISPTTHLPPKTPELITPNPTATLLSYYTPDNQITHLLAPLKSLGPLVNTLTITAAPERFITELAIALRGAAAADDQTLRTAEMEQHVTFRLPAEAYPFPMLPGQRAVVDFGPRQRGGVGVVVVVGGGAEGWEGEDGCRMLGVVSTGETEGGGDIKGVPPRRAARRRTGLGGLALRFRGGGGDIGGEEEEKEEGKMGQGVFGRMVGGSRKGLFGLG
ncbi:hypothetical protein C8A00DRAFT_32993 [Chaetomidium leptoderma]|uniref:Uncharacterized protein n=1 Tax=Chaetomidium leptoderma TaxID=669021 RepID=A0AAN6ZXU8_9PEZI|nr:hypothetical protein C8A00DRAFT_32993 [Chaetomidium leptoderma]